jgi:hypothetical protein
MSKRFVSLGIILGLCLATIAQAANIIWVSDNKTPTNNVPADQAWVDLLVAQGYTVDLSFRNKEARTLDAAEIDALNAADLIIVSRDTNSGDYASDATEVTQWNGIKTPIILQIAIIAQNNRWRWLDTSSNTGAQPNLEAVVPSHPIFQGVTLTANNQVSMLTSNSSLSNATSAGNGTLIGKRADNG